MRRLPTWAAAAVLPGLLGSLLMIGCSGGGGAPKDRGSLDTGKDAKTTGSNTLEALAATGSGTLKGRVTLDCPEPDLAAEATYIQGQMKANALHGALCLSGPKDEIDQQKWRVGPNRGLGNVFVWLQPPAGHYFKVGLSKKTWPAEVIIDQPHCAFVPRAAVLSPSAYNGENPKEPISTGQKLIVKNTAPMNHNVAWKGGDVNAGDNKVTPSKGQLTIELQPDPDPVMLHCDMHRWMDGVIRVFDHPYATVTDKDGRYEINGVPTGAEVSIVVWHEVGRYGNKGKHGDKVTLKAGENVMPDYTIRAM